MREKYVFDDDGKKPEKSSREKKETNLRREAEQLRFHPAVHLLVLAFPEGHEDVVHAPVDC